MKRLTVIESLDDLEKVTSRKRRQDGDETPVLSQGKLVIDWETKTVDLDTNQPFHLDTLFALGAVIRAAVKATYKLNVEFSTELKEPNV